MLALEDKLEMYRKMYLIRVFEERAEELYMEGKIWGTFTSMWEKKVAVGACSALRTDDYITSTIGVMDIV